MTSITLALVETLEECFQAVDSDRAFDAESWIGLAARLGEDSVPSVWNHPELGPVAKALDQYCSAVQHDRHLVGDIPVAELRRLLETAFTALKEGSLSAIPEKLSTFI